MITITLNQIRECRSYDDCWKTLLKHLGKTQADDEAFPFSEIVRSNGLADAILALRCLDDETPARLFAVACAQDVLHLMKDDRSVNAVRVAHLFANGECDEVKLDASRAAAWDAAKDASWAAARASAWAAAKASAWASAWDVAWAARSARAAADAAKPQQAEWLIAIADNYEGES